MGIGIALDDVGADRRSLALMPFLRPDVVKLDLRLVQDRPSKQVAEVHNAVQRPRRAHGRDGGGGGHRDRGARSSGHAPWAPPWARAGCSAAPGRYPRRHHVPRCAHPHRRARAGRCPRTRRSGSSTGSRPQRRGTKRLLLEISRELERQAELLGDSAVLISTFQHARHFTPRQAELYGGLSRELAFVGALGENMTAAPFPGVRGEHAVRRGPAGPRVGHRRGGARTSPPRSPPGMWATPASPTWSAGSTSSSPTTAIWPCAPRAA